MLDAVTCSIVDNYSTERFISNEVAQLGKQTICNPKVVGSGLLCATICQHFDIYYNAINRDIYFKCVSVNQT